MPEGPEIRRAADQILLALRPFLVEEVYFSFSHLKPYAASLEGQRVREVATRGKAMLIRFSNDLHVYSHSQLYGRWMVRTAHQYPKTNRQLRLAIHNRKKSVFLYSASDIEVLTEAQIARHPYLVSLGPDVLSAKPDEVLKQVQAKRYRRRQFGSLLLDQRFLAGIGNYLRSEILFVASVHPQLRPIDCSDDQLEKLAQAAIRIPQQSYRYDGITYDLVEARALKAKGQRRRQYRHWVFNRENRPCRICGQSVVKDVAAGRRVYYCPACQPTA